MAVLLNVTKEWCKNNSEFVIYNYFAEKNIITKEQAQKELQERYDICLTEKQIDEIFKEYVMNGILKQGFRYYKYAPA